MLSIFKKFIHSFIEKPDIWFFYAFLATSMLSTRKVLFFYPINGSFNEYTGICIYLSDVFLFLTIISWLFILCNKYINLSIFNSALIVFKKKCSTWNIFSNTNTIENVPRGTFSRLKKTYQQIVHNYTVIFPLFLAIFSFASILWSNNHLIAFFRSTKLFGVILVFYFVFKNVPRGTFLKRALQIIIAISIFQSIVGIIQFLIQHSIGLLWLKESIISPNISGVAKTIFNGHVYIRSYGLFPHPNIFGGFLVFSIISTLIYFKTFQHTTMNCSTWNNSFKNNDKKIVPRGTIVSKWNILMKISLLIQGLALLLTFSKSAIFGLILAFLYLIIKRCSSSFPYNVPRGTLINWANIKKMFHVEHFYKKTLLIAGIVMLFFTILKPDTYSLLFKSLHEREFYLNVSRGTFLSNPFFGIGSGQFVVNMQNIPDIQSWQYQPVHNVFLLILNEYGIFILLLFLYFIFRMFHVERSDIISRNKCSTWNIYKIATKDLIGTYFKAILSSFIFIMLFDHYLLDIQQGQILLWIVFGAIIGECYF